VSVEINPAGTANMNVSIEGGSTFSNMTQGAIRAYPDENAIGTLKMTVKDSSFTNITSIVGNSIIDLWMLRGGAMLTTNIEGNTFDTIALPSAAASISALYFTDYLSEHGGVLPTFNATIKGNTFAHQTDGHAIFSRTLGGRVGTFKLLIDGNDFDSFGTANTRPIIVQGEGSTFPDLTVQNNKIGQKGPLWPADGNTAPIRISTQSGGRVHVKDNTVTANVNGTMSIVDLSAGDGGTLDATVTNNSLSGSGTATDGLLLQASGPLTTINATITGNNTHTKNIRLVRANSAAFNLTGGVNGLSVANAASGFPTQGTITNVSTVPTLPTLPPLP
jgi:hypothetical protein